MAYVPISRDTLAGKRWLRYSSMIFAKADTVAPIFINELPTAIQSLPAAFIKQEEHFVLVVMMGLKAGQNLCVSADGRWLSEYMPVTYRSSPFELLSIKEWGNQQTLCIDDKCIVDGDGELFFEDNGEVSEAVSNAFNLIQQFHSARPLTQAICDVLDKYNLIIPWPLVLNDGVTEQAVNGLYKIDEEALNTLSDEDFLAIRQAHALPLIYSQMLSMHKVSALAERLRHETLTATAINNSRNSDTFNFGGL